MRLPRYNLRTLIIVMAGLTVAMGLGIRWARPVPVLGCVIWADPTCQHGTAPTVKAAITNWTDADIYLVGCLDGSRAMERYPHCYFEVTRPDGTVADHMARACAYTNRLREEDFVRVPPDADFDPYQQIDDQGFFSAHELSADTFRAVGTYRIRFFYSSASADIAEWRGANLAENKKIAAMFKQVPKVAVRSNEIQVTVAAPVN
jgi:hypothetical protein